MAHDIFADESSQNNHKYMVLGAIITPTDNTSGLVAHLRKIRGSRLPGGEMKWTKVSKSKYDVYKAVIDGFFDLNDKNKIHYTCLIANTHKFKHHKYNYGDKEIGFSKLVYQLLLSFARSYKTPLYVYLDKRTTKQSLDELQLILNRGAAKSLGLESEPFRRVVFRDSKRTQLLQLTDVITGAIAFRRNGSHKAKNASKVKIDLSAHILERGKIKDLSKSSPRSRTRFNIWNFRLR